MLTTSDNNRGEHIDAPDTYEEILEALSGKQLTNFHSSHEFFVVDSRGFAGNNAQAKSEEKLETPIWNYQRHDSNNAKLTTYNVAAWVGNTKTEVQVHSRFDKSTQQHFLQYMLYKVFMPRMIEDFPSSYQMGKGLDVLPLLLIRALEQAYTQHGMYKEYVSQDVNDDRLRGPVDVARHLKENAPAHIFQGRMSYRLRQHEYDNRISQLLVHTLDYLQRSAQWKHLITHIEQDPKIREPLLLFRQHCRPAQRNERRKILRESEKPIRSSYYSHYEEVRRLCRSILQWEQMQLQGSKKSFGILFDLAWLWEEYLDSILKTKGVTHIYAQQKKEYRIFQETTECIYPDFFDEERKLVLDAKYKHLDNSKINREDIFQLISYIHILKATHGILIYPKESADIGEKIHKQKRTINGMGGILSTLELPIPQDAEDMSSFIQLMQGQEKQLVQMVDEYESTETS